MKVIKVSSKSSQACDNCRKKKVRCDGKYPKCSLCLKKDICCTYVLDSRRRGPKNIETTEFERRLSILENKIKQNTINNLSIKRINLNNNSISNVIKDKTIPPLNICDSLFKQFFENIHPNVRFIHKSTFLKKFQSGNFSYLLVNSVFSIASKFYTINDICSGDIFYKRALGFLDAEQLTQPNFETVQALILLSLYDYGRMEGFSSWNFVVKIYRLAQQIGLYNQDIKNIIEAHEDWLTRETHRRIWWGCFIADSFASSIVGRPMSINEIDFLSSLPSDDHLWDPDFSSVLSIANNTIIKDISFNSESSFFNLSSFFIKSCFLLGKITLYLTKKIINTDLVFNIVYDPEFEIYKELNIEVEKLFLSLPENLLALNFPVFESTKELFKVSSCIFCLHHSNIILLNRGILAQSQKFDNYEVTNECKTNCVNAALAITNFLKIHLSNMKYLIDPYFPFLIFNALTVIINTIYDSKYIDYPMDLIKEREVGIHVLEYMSGFWNTGKIFLNILYSLQSFLFFQSGLGQVINWEVPHSISYFDWYYSMQQTQSHPITS